MRLRQYGTLWGGTNVFFRLPIQMFPSKRINKALVIQGRIRLCGALWGNRLPNLDNEKGS